jgi:hypothetical protein
MFRLSPWLGTAALLLSLSSLLGCERKPPEPWVTVVKVSGRIQLEQGGSLSSRPLSPGSMLMPDECVFVGSGTLTLQLSDRTRFVLRAGELACIGSGRPSEASVRRAGSTDRSLEHGRR